MFTDSRHVRVFLTYTYDNNRHMKNVLRVCDCLKKNNFSVGLDARESHLLRERGEKTRWHDMRYDKVGSFIVILAVNIFDERSLHHCDVEHEWDDVALYHQSTSGQ